jgi:hypothetical protein
MLSREETKEDVVAVETLGVDGWRAGLPGRRGVFLG